MLRGGGAQSKELGLSNCVSLLNILGFLICLKLMYFEIYIFQSCVRFVPKIAPSPVLSK